MMRQGTRPSFLRWITYAEAVAGGALLILLFALMLTQAVQRYLPDGGWTWTGELARYGLVWLTFAMAGHLMAHDRHITLKLVDHVARGRILRLVVVFAHIVVAVVCLNLAYEAFALLQRPIEQLSPAMGIPLRFLYLMPLAGLLLTTVRSIAEIIWPHTPPRTPPTADPLSGEGGGGAG